MSVRTRSLSTNPAWITIALFVAILFGGCASTRMAQVDPADAATALKKGDQIEITRKGGEFVPLKVEDVTNTEVVGDNVRVPIEDIAAITKYVKGPPNPDNSSISSEAEYLWGWVSAFLIWAAIL